MTEGTPASGHMKTVFLGEIAKYEGQTVTEYFAVAQKQFSRKRDGAVYLSLRLTDRTGQCEAKMWDSFEALRGHLRSRRRCESAG